MSLIKSSSFFVLGMCVMTMTSVDADGQVVINEIMQSNIDCIMDDLNEFPDSWVELYNAGSDDVDMSHLSLSDTEDASSAWNLKAGGTLHAGDYALVYCDKAETRMHTPFRLETGKGCAVYLFSDNVVIDKLENLKKQPAPNIAYGRTTDNADDWGYMAVPTPGAANCGEVCKEILPDPIFSEKGRVVTGSKIINLALSIPEDAPAEAEIRMTFDGTEPTETSELYTHPLTINSTKIVRAKIFCKGYLSPRSAVQSFVYFPRTMTLPIVSIATNDKYLNDNKIGIFVEGTGSKKNYENDWRRPINFELFEKAGEESVINQLCETRVQGGATRSNKLKSMAVYANKRFGVKRFDYEFFPDQKPGIDKFKSILLRNAGNDFDYLYMRDAIIQRTMSSHVDLDWQAWKPVVVYINGEYHGILCIRERSNEDNIYSNYDGLEDIDMVENNVELKTGTWDNFNAFKNFYNEQGHTLEEYSKWIDWSEYADLMIMNLYYNNQDFPGNNIVAWRPRTEEGIWRFIVKDTDFGMGLYGTPYNYKTLDWLHNPDYDSNRKWGANSYDNTRLFRRMMEIEEFRDVFFDRTAVYMGDFLNEAGTREVWDPMYSLIRTEYTYHRQGINPWWPNYSDEVNNARTWLRNRTSFFYSHVASYYKLGTPVKLTVNKDITDNVITAMNEVWLSKGVFDGKFFKNRVMTIHGHLKDEKPIGGWIIKQTYSDGTTSEKVVADTICSFTMPDCASVSVNAIIGEVGIKDVKITNWNYSDNGSGFTLENVDESERVELYNLQGVAIFKGVAKNGTVDIPVNQHGVFILKVGSESMKIRRK